jgi:hypothetical protein
MHVVSLNCNQPFKCPRCNKDFVDGDVISLLINGNIKKRYCEDCACILLNKTAGTTPTTDTTAPDTEALKSLANRLAALEASFVQRVTALEARLDGLAYVDYRPELNELLERLDNQGARINTLNAQLQATAGLKK